MNMIHVLRRVWIILYYSRNYEQISRCKFSTAKNATRAPPPYHFCTVGHIQPYCTDIHKHFYGFLLNIKTSKKCNRVVMGGTGVDQAFFKETPK